MLEPQTIVGMSAWMMHHNEDIFPNAEKFDPSRWLDPIAARVLEKHLVAFGKGSRQCVGMPYAFPLPIPSSSHLTCEYGANFGTDLLIVRSM
jgi:hypothetical protein